MVETVFQSAGSFSKRKGIKGIQPQKEAGNHTGSPRFRKKVLQRLKFSSSSDFFTPLQNQICFANLAPSSSLVRTSASQAENAGSNPAGAIIALPVLRPASAGRDLANVLAINLWTSAGNPAGATKAFRFFPGSIYCAGE